MKTVQLFTYAAVFSFLLTSCSSEETFMEEPIAENLIKSYSIKRDISGAYYVDYNLADNTAVTSNNNSNTQTIAAYSSNNAAKTKHSEDLNLENNQLKVDFISENTNEKAQITIFDKDIVLAKGSENNEMLAEYSITKNEDNTYSLGFTVKEGIIVDFVYNEELAEYEIHLEEGNAATTAFNRILEKEEGMPLVFAFFQHSINIAAKTNDPGKGRPRTVIKTGGSH